MPLLKAKYSKGFAMLVVFLASAICHEFWWGGAVGKLSFGGFLIFGA